MKYSDIAKMTPEEYQAFLESEEELEIDIQLDEEAFREAEAEIALDIAMDEFDNRIAMEYDNADEESDSYEEDDE